MRPGGVAEEAVGLVDLAGVHVGFAGVAGGVDKKRGAKLAQIGGEHRLVCVIELGASKAAEGNALLSEELLVGLADVAGAAE
jgi:TRAP-type mannitol/chloroaromatic compound transport system substrate-binding protein